MPHHAMQIAGKSPDPQRHLRLSSTTLLASACALITCVLIAYPYAQRFCLGTQIAAHLAIPVSAGFFKLGYVIRLAAAEAIRKMEV